MDGPGAGTSGLAAASQDQENYPTLAPRTALEWGTRVQLQKLGRRVEDWRRGSVGTAYLLLPVSSGSASLAEP
jgi:hypothetical protein